MVPSIFMVIMCALASESSRCSVGFRTSLETAVNTSFVEGVALMRDEVDVSFPQNAQDSLLISHTEALDACTAHCLATTCSCFDIKPGICRLTNWSTAVQQSAEGFVAYVDGRKPHPSPSPSPHHGGAPIGKSGEARYGCIGEHATQPFCDATLPIAERVAKLIALLTPEEKGSLMAARTTDWTNAIERLGVPLFCWGQNSAQGYLQTGLPPTGGGITTFPRAPGMAATCASLGAVTFANGKACAT